MNEILNDCWHGHFARAWDAACAHMAAADGSPRWASWLLIFLSVLAYAVAFAYRRRASRLQRRNEAAVRILTEASAALDRADSPELPANRMVSSPGEEGRERRRYERVLELAHRQHRDTLEWAERMFVKAGNLAHVMVAAALNEEDVERLPSGTVIRTEDDRGVVREWVVERADDGDGDIPSP